MSDSKGTCLDCTRSRLEVNLFGQLGQYVTPDVFFCGYTALPPSAVSTTSCIDVIAWIGTFDEPPYRGDILAADLPDKATMPCPGWLRKPSQ